MELDLNSCFRELTSAAAEFLEEEKKQSREDLNLRREGRFISFSFIPWRKSLQCVQVRPARF